MDFEDFGHFWKGPVHDFSQEFTILERSFSVFVIFTEFSLPERVLERSLSIFTILLRIFMQIFAFFNEFDGFCMILTLF